MIAWVSWRALIEKIGGTSQVLTCLSTDKECISGVELAERFTFFSAEEPIDKWYDTIQEIKQVYQSDYFFTFGALGTTLFFATLPESVAHTLFTLALDNFLPPNYGDFFNNVFVPELLPLTRKLDLGFWAGLDIFVRASGMLIKIFWSFFNQEQFLTPDFLINSSIAKHLSATVTPYVMGLGSKIDKIA